MSSEENKVNLDKVALQFQSNMQAAKDLIDRIESKNALARVYKAFIEYPLGDTTSPKFRSDDESRLFIASINALMAKNTMVGEVIKDQASKLKAAEEGFAAEMAKENSNG